MREKFFYEDIPFENLPEGMEKDKLRALQNKYAGLADEIEAAPAGKIVLRKNGSVYIDGFNNSVWEKIKAV